MQKRGKRSATKTTKKVAAKEAVKKAPDKQSTKAKKRSVAKPRKAAPKKQGEKGCNTPSRVDVFVQEYLVDLNGRQAAIRAGYSPASARQTASELLATSEVQEAVTKAMVERSRRVGITADDVLRRWWDVATADPREMVEHYRSCCRYCWGKDHRYQRTPRELEEARTEHYAAQVREQRDAKAEGRKAIALGPFDEAGGVGYDPRKDPHPECPECFGEGVERVYAKDTRDLSPAARLLYAGVKTTQHGLEIKTHDQMTALSNVAKHLGMFKEKVELTGKDGQELAGVVVVPAKVVQAHEKDPLEDQQEPSLDDGERTEPKDGTRPTFQVRASR